MHRDQAERGASLVEYALLVALVATASVGAIGSIGSNSRQKLEDVSTEIATDAPAAEPSGEGEPGPGTGSGGGGSGSGGSSGGATTTAPSTSVPVSTTEPSPPVSEPPEPLTVAGQFTDVETWRSGRNWRGSVKLKIRDQHGDAVSGAAIQIRISGRHLDPETVTVTTGAHGTTTIEVGPYSRNGRDAIDEVEVRIVAVEAGDEFRWEGDGGAVALRSP